MPEPLALEPGNVIKQAPSVPAADKLGNSGAFVVPGLEAPAPTAAPPAPTIPSIPTSPPEVTPDGAFTVPGLEAPQAAPSPLATDPAPAAAPAPNVAVDPNQPAQLSGGVEKDQFEPGLAGTINQAAGYTNRATIGVIKSIFHMDPNYTIDALKGQKVDFDKDIDNLINSSDARAWSPVALMAPALQQIGPSIGLGDQAHTNKTISNAIEQEKQFTKGFLKLGASLIDPLILAEPILKAFGLGKAAEVVAKAGEFHPANLLVKAPLAIADKAAMAGITGVSKLVGSSLVEDAAKAYGVESFKGIGDWVPMGRAWSSKALINSPQVLSHGLTSGFNNKALTSITAGFAKNFGFLSGGMHNSRDFMQDLAKDADPKFLMLKFGQSWEDTARPIIDKLVADYKMPSITAQNLVRDIATARIGAVDKKLAELYPKVYEKSIAGQNIQDYTKNAQGGIRAAVEQYFQNAEQNLLAQATAAGVPEPEFYAHAGQISKMVEEHEHDLSLMSRAAVRASGKEESQAKTIADFYQYHNDQAYKTIYEFDSTLRTLTEKGVIPPLPYDAPPEQVIAHIESSLKAAPPEVINKLLQDGSIARLPMMTDEISKTLLDKASEVSPLVHIDDKMAKNIMAQKQMLLENPRLAYERSLNTMRQEIQKSTIADQIPSEAAKYGWGGKDPNLIRKGFEELDPKTLDALGPKGKQLEGMLFHPQAKAMIGLLTDLHTNPEKMNEFFQGLSQVTGAWKAGVLSNPVTVINNMAGNMMQFQIARGETRMFPQTVGLLKKFIENPLQAYKADPLIRELVDSEAFSPNFIRQVLDKRGINNEAMYKQFLPNLKYGLVPEAAAKVGNSLNTVSDEFFVAASYLTQRSKGMSQNAAKRYTESYWYNTSAASQLTGFEKGLQSVIPFWRWAKNNIPGQVTNLVKNPVAPLWQVNMYHKLGLSGDTFGPDVSGTPGGVSHISDSGEYSSIDKSSAIPAMDLVKLATGIEQASQDGLRGVVAGVGTATGLGPTQGISPLISVGITAAQAYQNKNAGTRNFMGIDAPNYVDILGSAVPGLRDLDILLRGTGLAGSGPVDQGILTPPIPGKPGILGGKAPTSEETRTATQTLLNFFGNPSERYLTLTKLTDMKPKDRSAILKMAEMKLKELKSRPTVDPKVKEGFADYYDNMLDFVTALNDKDELKKENPMAGKKAKPGMTEQQQTDIEDQSREMKGVNKQVERAGKGIRRYSKDSKEGI